LKDLQKTRQDKVRVNNNISLQCFNGPTSSWKTNLLLWSKLQ